MEDEFMPNEKVFTIDNIPRCINCNLIPLLKLKYKDGKSTINYECENNHKVEILLDEYIQKCFKYSLIRQICEECKGNLSEAPIEFYCSKCNKFICNNCSNKHKIGEKQHNITYIKRYDSLCKIHSNFYSFYCIKCKKNTCIYCKNEHIYHDLIDLSKEIYSDENKKK